MFTLAIVVATLSLALVGGALVSLRRSRGAGASSDPVAAWEAIIKELLSGRLAEDPRILDNTSRTTSE